MLRKDDILLTQPALWSKLKVYGKTIKYVQLLTPNLSSSTSVVPSTSGFGSYITILEPSLVGHKVYVKITADDNRISLGWYKNENGVMGYDLITGNELNASSTPSATEGVYEITQDMVHSGTNYLQIYWFVYSGLPTGSHTITVQLVDLTELGMDNIINPVLFNATDLGKYMQNNILNRGSGLISVESPLSCYKNRQLPFAYQEVEYIESTGTQYIDTGIKANSNVGAKVDFQYISQISETHILSSRDSSGNRFYVPYSTGGTTLAYGWSSFYGNVGTLNLNRHTTSLNYYNDKLSKIDETNIAQLSATFSNNFSIYIFGINNNGNFTNPSISKIFSVQITEGSNLVRNMIPCYRKADGVIGMYDTVNDVFYINKGTGTFLKGKDVNVITLNLIKEGNHIKLNGLYKASSLLGKQNVKTNINEMYNNIYVYCLRNGSFINETSASTQVSTFNIISDHKYFGLIEYENDIIDFTNNERVNMRAFDGTSSITGYIIPSSNYRKNGRIDCGVFTFGVSQTNANVNFRYVANGTGVVAKVKNALVIDLTALGLDNLTAQQFYDNYHDKFDMLANGQSVCLLSDTYTNYNGKYNKVLGEVDLGTLNWTLATNNVFYTLNLTNMKNLNMLCAKYTTASGYFDQITLGDKQISKNSAQQILYIRDTAYTDAQAFKTAMSGVKLIFELATPITETLSSKMIPSGITEIIDKNGVSVEYKKQ